LQYGGNLNLASQSSFYATAPLTGGMRLRWGVDCSPDHRLKNEQHRLWLSDPLALYGVENAKLAPRYQASAAKASRK
jgi:hypothetical protein